MNFSLVKVLVVLLGFFLLQATAFLSKVSAYYTNMPASVVVGQPDFTSKSLNQGGSAAANTLRNPGQVLIVNNKLIVADNDNNRVLIWNTVPTDSNTSADVVIGQSSFTITAEDAPGGGTASANSIDDPFGLASDGQKLFIADSDNNRVLIYNSIPTTNTASADVVIGQSSMTGQSPGVTDAKLDHPVGLAYDSSQGKLIIFDANNSRVLVYNSIPTTNGESADVVIGQPDFTSKLVNQGGSVAANTLHLGFTSGVGTFNGKLFIGDRLNNRVLIYNQIPTTNNAHADVVIGQSDFTSNSANHNAAISSSGLQLAGGGQADEKGRLFVYDRSNARVLIFNQVPTRNGAAADMVIGQPNFSSGTGGTTNSLLNVNPFGVAISQNRLVVSDSANHRLLIFYNQEFQPGITINGEPNPVEGKAGLLKISGSANTVDIYKVQSVEYSVNGSEWHGARASDGEFDSTSEEFDFEFDPKENQQKDENGVALEGYTLRVRATNNNTDRIDNLFYFTPFKTDGIEEKATGYPTFKFKVHMNQGALYESLDHYRLEVRRGEGDWQTVVDKIPVNFNTRKFDQENLQREKYFSWDTKNGEYETDEFVAKYEDDSSSIKIRSKTTALSGTYKWRVIAVDKIGHTQSSDEQQIFVRRTNSQILDNPFPFAILNISGVGDPFLNSFNLLGAKDSYTTRTTTPIFFGIAWTGAEVKLKFTKQDCYSNCEKNYTTTANEDSRFGINVPEGELQSGANYRVLPTVSLDEKYNELPEFTLKVGK